MLRIRGFYIYFEILCLFLLFSIAYADTGFVKRPDVQAFIDRMEKKHGFNKQTLNNLFNQVKIQPRVIKQINRPLEKEAWRLYQMLFVNEWRIQHGVDFWNKYEKALNRAQTEFGVPASIIVATIGIETKYGQKNGEYRAIDALTNLAFSNSTRALFFRKELEEFLLLTKEQQLDPLKVMGSYAGAIGQPQFMPSSYRYYAINFSKSGKIDLMHNEIDVIGSIANYYKLHGWKSDEPIAIQAIMIGDHYNYFIRNNNTGHIYSLSELYQYGIMPKYKIAKKDGKVKLIELDSHFSKEYWISFRNFDVIKRYNASDLYAMAIYQLSYYITTLRDRLNRS